MKCNSVKVRVGKSEDGRQIVSMVLGNFRSTDGPETVAWDEVAWIEMSPGMADNFAGQLQEAAYEIRHAAYQASKEKTP